MQRLYFTKRRKVKAEDERAAGQLEEGPAVDAAKRTFIVTSTVGVASSHTSARLVTPSNSLLSRSGGSKQERQHEPRHEPANVCHVGDASGFGSIADRSNPTNELQYDP